VGVSTHGSRRSRWVLIVLGAVAVAGAVTALLLRQWRQATGEVAHRPSIIIVSLDTLRADHLPFYGYDRPTTRLLDSFVAEAVSFAEARCQSTGTLTSHLSLITSLYPPQFRITRNDGVNGNQSCTTLRLPEAVLTLAEVLRGHGYETAGFSDGILVSDYYGFAQGFDTFRVKRTSFRGLSSTLPSVAQFLAHRQAAASALSGGAGRGGRTATDTLATGPLFLFIHTYDIHEPYDAGRPFARAFSKRTFAEVAEHLGYRPVPSLLNERLDSLGADDATEVEDLYDNGILATDDQLAGLFGILQAYDLYRDSIIVILSDHGEEFLEHGNFNHGPTVYEELVRVPLFIRLPQARHGGTLIEAPVALLDVGPTVLDLAGFPIPPEFEGKSLASLMEGARWSGRKGQAEGDVAGVEGSARTLFFDTPNLELGVHGLLRGRWKLIRNTARGTTELYDLATDPLERRNLVAARADVSQPLEDELASWVAAMEEGGREHGWLAQPRESTDDEDTERLEQLRALGYVR
jgi:arylsulfatase A-like enzyme